VQIQLKLFARVLAVIKRGMSTVDTKCAVHSKNVKHNSGHFKIPLSSWQKNSVRIFLEIVFMKKSYNSQYF